MALDQADALIVLCTPNSARSTYGNEEIRLFNGNLRAMIIPVSPAVNQATLSGSAFPRL